ncbi:glutamate receptor, ionotropic, invertebrate [Anopheles darlingi]|uniref:Glutamate receptor, ionotropic, invertebrate n=1 Tax=Anopheles darlingi TaxID=43151 RepID=W5JU59_ANODA|nr:glutamate receptor, ionotropic, invertebrate [Anopheles darlingi]
MQGTTAEVVQLTLSYVDPREGEETIEIRRINDRLRRTIEVVVHEKEHPEIPSWVSDAIAKVLRNMRGATVRDYYIEYDRERVQFVDDEQLCGVLDKGVSLLLDATWIDSSYIVAAANQLGIPYLHIDLSVQTYVKVMETYIRARSGNDVVYILAGSREADATIYLLVMDSYLRAIVFSGLQGDTIRRIKAIRPYPSHYAVIANTQQMNTLLRQALDGGLVRKPEKWNLLVTDLHSHGLVNSVRCSDMNRLQLTASTCCLLLQQIAPCVCPVQFNPRKAHLDNVVAEILQWSTEVQLPIVRSENCTLENATSVEGSSSVDTKELVDRLAAMEPFWVTPGSTMIRANHNFSIINPAVIRNLSSTAPSSGRLDPETPIGSIVRGRVSLVPNRTLSAGKRFFRVGTTESIPWAYRKRDPVTGSLLQDPVSGGPIWEGYCIDFLHQLSVVMNFDYDLVAPRNGTFGQRRDVDGRWDGLVGELVVGEIDFAVASIKMTAEREEVIDFVAPYFEQTGILIAMRKPVRETSLFKFMTVLRLEVWLSILLAIVATAVMLWLLDKFSPYSARNNKDAYPYECRDFTLKESFWFALTSFTPQGGGEAPKALSGRTLVAAYWLFVVLMLATFTANLAAFLTVERMQTPVQSLEQLSRQSRIKYTVVRDSDTHDYFRNMKNAEDVLYQMWRNLTLRSGNDQAQYRVWDYPIREQYINILAAIESAGPVATAADGFGRVNERLDADFAFIHDSAEIKYEISRNCNLTEVGEVFAEQPYGIAVQQGSHLQDELSYFILELQKERFFESLTAKFWNNSVRGQCPNTDDSEGITLESLGGVFIATLVGLALAMITLLGEVIYYRRKERRNGNTITQVVPFAAAPEKGLVKGISSSSKPTTTFALKEKSIASVKKLIAATDPPPNKVSNVNKRVNKKRGVANEKAAIPQDITIGGKLQQKNSHNCTRYGASRKLDSMCTPHRRHLESWKAHTERASKQCEASILYLRIDRGGVAMASVLAAFSGLSYPPRHRKSSLTVDTHTGPEVQMGGHTNTLALPVRAGCWFGASGTIVQ